MSNNPVYIISVTTADPVEVLRKLNEIAALPGALVSAYVPAPLGGVGLPPVPQPLWRGRTTGGLRVRLSNGSPTNKVIPSGTTVSIWGSAATLGTPPNVYEDRLFIDEALNENIWAGLVVGIAGTGGGEVGFTLLWPVDTTAITQRFGERPAVYVPLGLAGHEGLDLPVSPGDPVRTMAAGVVSEVIVPALDWPAGHAYGVHVRITHNTGGRHYKTVYGHLRRATVTVGQTVQAGAILGEADNTGNSSDDHLHVGIYEDDANGNRLNFDNGYKGYFDPLPLMRYRS